MQIDISSHIGKHQLTIRIAGKFTFQAHNEFRKSLHGLLSEQIAVVTLDFAEIGNWRRRCGRPTATAPARQGSALEITLWSLKFRWWASQHDAIAGPRPQVRPFVLFHDPALTPQPPHSTGLATRQPIWPQGYAEPDKQPRHLQTWSEIMAGRIPQAPDQAIHPAGLIDALIGKETAREIGLWRGK